MIPFLRATSKALSVRSTTRPSRQAANLSGEAASLGFSTLMNLAGLLSVSIGLLNLFPIPLLDGGHLMFYAVEAALGRPLSERVQDIGFRVGFALIVMLMIFTVWNDLTHIGGS